MTKILALLASLAFLFGVSCPGGKNDKQPPTPKPSVIASRLVASTSGNSYCWLKKTGEVWCWGDNAAPDGTSIGLLGVGDTVNPVVFSATKVQGIPLLKYIAGGSSLLSLKDATSSPEFCGVAQDDSTVCWGGLSQNITTPHFVALAGGFGGFCGQEKGGKVSCWGNNLGITKYDFGLFGGSLITSPGILGSNKISPVIDSPTAVSDTLVFTALAATPTGAYCGLTDTGPNCWGINGFEYSPSGTAGTKYKNLLGTNNPNKNINISPVPLSTTAMSQIAGGYYSFCTLIADGTPYCVGLNSIHTLGAIKVKQILGTQETGNSVTPLTLVENSPKFASIAGNTRGAYCGLQSDGTADCWGLNFWPQQVKELPVGLGALAVKDVKSEVIIKPTPVETTHKFSQLAGAASSFCGISTDEMAYCWGNNRGFKMAANYLGTLGTGDKTKEILNQPALVQTAP